MSVNRIPSRVLDSSTVMVSPFSAMTTVARYWTVFAVCFFRSTGRIDRVRLRNSRRVIEQQSVGHLVQTQRGPATKVSCMLVQRSTIHLNWG